MTFFFRVVSGIQALLAIMISARTIFICKDIMTDVDPFIHAYIWFAISYFPYDIVVMYLGYAYKEAQSKAHLSFIQSFWSFFLREPVLVLHHIIFLAVGLPIVEVSFVFFNYWHSRSQEAFNHWGQPYNQYRATL